MAAFRYYFSLTTAKQISGSHMLLADLYLHMRPEYLWLVPRYRSLLFEMPSSSHAQTTRRSRYCHKFTVTATTDVEVSKSQRRHINVTQDGFDKVSESLHYSFLKDNFVLVILIGTLLSC